MKLYHGSHNEIMGTHAAHIGLCLTDSLTAAARYAGAHGIVYSADIDVSDAVTVDGYDHDSDTAPGDAGETVDADVIEYDDEDESGSCHTTWRLMSADAVAGCALTIECYVDPSDCACTDGCELCVDHAFHA